MLRALQKVHAPHGLILLHALINSFFAPQTHAPLASAGPFDPPLHCAKQNKTLALIFFRAADIYGHKDPTRQKASCRKLVRPLLERRQRLRSLSDRSNPPPSSDAPSVTPICFPRFQRRFASCSSYVVLILSRNTFLLRR